MKTAKKILTNQIFRTKCDFTDEEYWNIYRAMEEYAQQFKTDLREELIKFLYYYHFTINDKQRHGFITTVVDEYLKSKPCLR